MMSDPVTLDKRSLRAECAAMRGRIGDAEARRASEALARHLLEMIPSRGIVAGYRAVRGEIDLAPALAQLAARGQTLCLPVIEGQMLPLFFRRWHPGEVLEKGMYGIEVPPESEPHVMPDIVIVPLLAFDKAGHRLGYGAGYYDRTLEALRRSNGRVRTVGTAYAAQQVDAIPVDEYDQALDAVVTEKGTLLFS